MWRCGCEEDHRRADQDASCAKCGCFNPAHRSVPDEAIESLGYLMAMVGPRSALPTLPEWNKLSGLDNHVRATSQVTEVDTRLEKFWSAFSSGNKLAALKALEALEERARWYLSYEANKRYGALVRNPEPSQRVPAVEHLLQLIIEERRRFETQWPEGRRHPSRIWGSLAICGTRLGVHDEEDGQTLEKVAESWMDLRTHVPTPESWQALSKAGATHIRSNSSITSVDKALEDFWLAFNGRQRKNSLEKLEALHTAVRTYLSYQANKKYASWMIFSKEPSARVPAAAQLLSIVAGELRRLRVEWPDGGLPPLLEVEVVEQVEPSEEVLELAEEVSAENSGSSNSSTTLLTSLPTVSEALRRLETASGPLDRRRVIKSMLKAQKNWARGDLLGEALDTTIAAEATWADVVSLADAINSNIQKQEADPLDFLTASSWASSVGFFVSLLSLAAQLRGMHRDGVSASGVAKATFGLGVTGVRGAATVEAWHTAIHGTSALGQAATPIAATGAGVGIFASLVGLVSAIKEARHVTTVGDRFKWAAAKEPRLWAILELSEPFRFFRRKVQGKLKRRTYRAAVDIATGTAGVVGGGIGLTFGVLAVTGGANIWNPIGWACVGVATLGGLGMVGYKVGRRAYKEGKLDQARPKYEIPRWVGTTGEWQRLLIADLVVRSASEDPLLPEDWKLLGRVLNWILLGGALTDAQAEARAMGHAGIMAFIKG